MTGLLVLLAAAGLMAGWLGWCDRVAARDDGERARLRRAAQHAQREAAL